MSTSKRVQAGDRNNVMRRLFVWVETDLIRRPLEFPFCEFKMLTESLQDCRMLALLVVWLPFFVMGVSVLI